MHCKIKYVEIAAFKQLWYYFKKCTFCDSFGICLPESVKKSSCCVRYGNGFILLQLVEKYGRFVQSFLKRAIETKSKKCNGERNLRELIR